MRGLYYFNSTFVLVLILIISISKHGFDFSYIMNVLLSNVGVYGFLSSLAPECFNLVEPTTLTFLFGHFFDLGIFGFETASGCLSWTGLNLGAHKIDGNLTLTCIAKAQKSD